MSKQTKLRFSRRLIKAPPVATHVLLGSVPKETIQLTATCKDKEHFGFDETPWQNEKARLLSDVFPDRWVNSNSIVSTENLVSFVCSNFCCAVCNSKVDATTFSVSVNGIASKFDWTCQSCDTPKTRLDPVLLASKVPRLQQPARDHQLNVELCLFLMFLGRGREEADMFMGFFGINKTYNISRVWLELEDVIGGQLENLTKRVLKENIKLETDGVEADANDRMPVDVAGDVGWNKRSSGRRYDSMSGHHFLVGMATGTFIELKFSFVYLLLELTH